MAPEGTLNKILPKDSSQCRECNARQVEDQMKSGLGVDIKALKASTQRVRAQGAQKMR